MNRTTQQYFNEELDCIKSALKSGKITLEDGAKRIFFALEECKEIYENHFEYNSNTSDSFNYLKSFHKAMGILYNLSKGN